jgi:hypothetical protein
MSDEGIGIRWSRNATDNALCCHIIFDRENDDDALELLICNDALFHNKAALGDMLYESIHNAVEAWLKSVAELAGVELNEPEESGKAPWASERN